MQPFQLLIKPSGPDCNLSCTYCFYRRVAKIFPPGPHRMKKDILEEMVKQYMNLNFQTSVFSWQGGEPTLCGLDFYKEAVNLQMKYGKEGQRVGNSFQTNGILLDEEWCKFFNNYKFFIGISLDGPKDLHDFYRGIGTFEKVMKSIKLLKEFGVKFNVLSVLTKKSEGRAKEIFSFLIENGLRFLQFIPCVEVEKGSIAPFSITPQGYGEFLCELFDEWWNVKDKISIRLFDSIIEKLITGKMLSYCVLSPRCGHYLVVEHDGSVYPCDFFVRKDKYLGNIKEKNIEEIYDSPLLKRFAIQKSFLSPECEECKYKEFCYGGCQKDRINLKGEKASKTIFCYSYKTFFSYALPRLKNYAESLLKKTIK